MIRIFRVWYYLTQASFQTFFASRFGTILFLIGKILRFIFFLSFLILLFSKTQLLLSYNLWQVILFYLTFNLIDSTTQMLFREVYRFRQQVLTGNFDLILVKPVSSLFRSLFGWTDLLDFLNLFPLIIFIGFAVSKISNVSIFGILTYIFLVFNALLIAASFHIFVLSLAILTTEIDHALMIYRDATSMGRIPINVYTEPVRSFITFVVPVGIMMSYPAQALIRQLNWQNILLAVIVSFVFFGSSLLSWKYALRQYTSASS